LIISLQIHFLKLSWFFPWHLNPKPFDHKSIMCYFNLTTSKNCDKGNNSLEKLELQYSPYHPTNDIQGNKIHPKHLCKYVFTFTTIILQPHIIANMYSLLQTFFYNPTIAQFPQIYQTWRGGCHYKPTPSNPLVLIIISIWNLIQMT
jgi:hypothetical protein